MKSKKIFKMLNTLEAEQYSTNIEYKSCPLFVNYFAVELNRIQIGANQRPWEKKLSMMDDRRIALCSLIQKLN